MSKPQALKRVPIDELDKMADDFMEFVPRGMVDLGDEERRIQMRQWVRRIVARAIDLSVESFQKATANAIEEAANLIKDPIYHQRMKARRTARLADKIAKAETKQILDIEDQFKRQYGKMPSA